MPKGIEALGGVFLPCVGEVSIDPGRVEVGGPQGTLEKPGMHTGFKAMGGVGMPQGMDGDAPGGAPGPGLGGAAGALDPAPTHGSGRGRALLVIPPGGGKAPGGVARRVPGGAQQREGRGGQGAVAVLGALATMARDREALAIDVGDLQGEGCMEPEAPVRDGGAGDLVVPGGQRCGAAGPPPP